MPLIAWLRLRGLMLAAGGTRGSEHIDKPRGVCRGWVLSHRMPLTACHRECFYRLLTFSKCNLIFTLGPHL